MPTFCRHNRLIQNCPICSREQSIEMRPVVSSPAPKVSSPRPASGAGRGEAGAASRRTGDATTRRSARGNGRGGGGSGGLRVRHLARGVDDGYACSLVPGLRSSADAARLAEEIAFAVHRLEVLEADPPGLLADLAGAAAGIEERTWLAFQIAYLSPLEEEDPFAEIARVRTTWSSGELPDLTDVRTGPRSPHVPTRDGATFEAYRAWAARSGSQQAAFTGEESWAPERRFDRVFERLALPGLTRDARYDLLVMLGRTGVYELRGGALHLGGENEATVAAKRALGIGDTMLLERRSNALAAATGVPLESLDLAFHNWGTARRAHGGLPLESEPDEGTVERVRDALDL